MNSKAKCTVLPKHSLVIFGIFGKRHPAPRAAGAEEGVITCYIWEGCLGNAEDCIAVHHPNSSSSADTARWELNQWARSLKLFCCNFSGLLLTPSIWVIWFTEQSDKQLLWLIRKSKAAVWSERQSGWLRWPNHSELSGNPSMSELKNMVYIFQHCSQRYHRNSHFSLYSLHLKIEQAKRCLFTLKQKL